MKNKLITLLTALVLIFTAFAFVGCDETQGGGEEPKTDTIALTNGAFDENNAATITVSEYTDIFSFADNIIAKRPKKIFFYVFYGCTA